VRLDAEREWRLIRALLLSPHVDVQWLYSSSLVKGLVLEHALATGDSPELLARAQTLMQEPLDGLPHDDHLHLRIACPPPSRERGCEGGGPDWSVLDPATTLSAATTPAALTDLERSIVSEANAELTTNGQSDSKPNGEEESFGW
jgi:penicillin-insensitive murein endopeptidase